MNIILAVAEATETASKGLTSTDIVLISLGVGAIIGAFLEHRYGPKVTAVVKAVETKTDAVVTAVK